MASKRRLRRNECRGKRSYPDKAAADVVVRGMLKTGTAMKSHGFLHAYRCKWGNGHWHVGHS